MRELRDLPNKEGYKFMGVCKDDTLLFCEVGKDKTGLHCAYDLETNEKIFNSETQNKGTQRSPFGMWS